MLSADAWTEFTEAQLIPPISNQQLFATANNSIKLHAQQLWARTFLDNNSHYIEPRESAGDGGKLFIDVATIRQSSRQKLSDLPITFRNQ